MIGPRALLRRRRLSRLRDQGIHPYLPPLDMLPCPDCGGAARRAGDHFECGCGWGTNRPGTSGGPPGT